jgi:hypothetical protein
MATQRGWSWRRTESPGWLRRRVAPSTMTAGLAGNASRPHQRGRRCRARAAATRAVPNNSSDPGSGTAELSAVVRISWRVMVPDDALNSASACVVFAKLMLVIAPPNAAGMPRTELRNASPDAFSTRSTFVEFDELFTVTDP